MMSLAERTPGHQQRGALKRDEISEITEQNTWQVACVLRQVPVC